MARLRDELELKVNVISLPIDVCVQEAVRGNTVRQPFLPVLGLRCWLSLLCQVRTQRARLYGVQKIEV